MADIIDFAEYRPFATRPVEPGAKSRVWGSIRYAGVLLVWMGLFMVRPRLALKIFRERRADSPLRWGDRHGIAPAPAAVLAPEGLIA
ncbi:hypothetical protein P7B02_07615 [Caulobacter segnis]|uniref:hypothetical protein n=1 Tax=Caulobacter segnis TaxID=88688 RepID=UPI00240F88B3|nr:hypothetical protein [Caulobacter segnis]MDG2521405.1 hypothetical protein [Caulobacter segnis]